MPWGGEGNREWVIVVDWITVPNSPLPPGIKLNFSTFIMSSVWWGELSCPLSLNLVT